MQCEFASFNRREPDFHFLRRENLVGIGVLFGLVWLKIHGTGLDVVYSICQGHLLLQKVTYAGLGFESDSRFELEPSGKIVHVSHGHA